MQKAVKCLEAAALLALIFFLGKASVVADKLTISLDHVDSLVVAAQPMVQSGNDAMQQLSYAAKKLNEAAGNETKFLNSETKEIAKVTAAAKELLVFTDRSLNDPKNGAIPAARDALVGTAQLETRAASDLDATTVELRPTLKSFSVGADAFATTMADPQLKASIDNAGKATGEAAAALVTVHKTIDYEANELMKPVTKAKAIAIFAARLVGRFFGF